VNFLVDALDFGLAKLRSADAHIRAKGTPGGGLADVGIRAPDVEDLHRASPLPASRGLLNRDLAVKVGDVLPGEIVSV
jgi:hypothetical protein